MDEKRLEELATYYDNQDISEEIATKPLERHEPADQVMIVSSIRLPKPTMDRVRDVAAAEGVKPTALMRRWIEEQLNRLEELEEAGLRGA